MARPKKVITPEDAAVNPAAASEGEIKPQEPQEPQEAPEAGGEPEQTEELLTVSTATATPISVGESEAPAADPRLVKVIISYPKNYEGKKILPEGERETSPESAEIFVKKGIAKIV